jgi:Ca2+-binding EF-hand superfamily protein
LAKLLGMTSGLRLNRRPFIDSRSLLMMPHSSHSPLTRQQRKAQRSFVQRHFNTCSVAILAVAALHMNPAFAQMSAPAKPAPEMRAKVQEAFARADKNRDGKLSKEEAAIMPAIAELFDKADVDKDGFLSKAEFAEVAKE